MVGESGSSITYAPIATCVYNSAEGGAFLYDRNLNGDLSDESAATVDVGVDELLSLNLAPTENSERFGVPISKLISTTSYQPPIAPQPDVGVD